MMRSICGIFLVILTAMPHGFAQLNSYSRSELASDNALAGYNPGFESGTVKWSATGGTFVVNSGTQFVPGSKQFASWDSNSAGQEVCSSLVNVPESGNCAVSLTYKVPSGTATHKIVAKDGSKDLSVEDVFSSTAAWRHDVEFPCAAAASKQARVCLRSVASNEPAIQFDSGYAGYARNVAQCGVDTPWVPYTPVITGLGTGSATITGMWRGVGDSIEVSFMMTMTSNGSGANAVEISIPSQFTMNASKFLSSDGPRGAAFSQATTILTCGANSNSNKIVLATNSGAATGSALVNSHIVRCSVNIPVNERTASQCVTPEQQRAPKITHYLSGSGTHTWSNGVTHATIEIIGGGGGGGGAGTSSTAGGAGGQSSFDGVNAPGGTGGGNGTGGGAGAPGAATAVPCTTNETLMCRGGARGAAGAVTDVSASSLHAPGGHGGQSRYGGAGLGLYESSGAAAQANTGSGGAGGAGDAATYYAGAGGTAGADITWHRVAPSGSASYTVGAAGAAGTGTRNGGAGGSGYIKVTEHFGYTTAILANSVSTQVSNGLKMESAKLTTTTGPNACAITSQFGTWLTGTPSSSGAGQCSFTIVTGTFSSAPNCDFDVYAGGSAISATGNASSATAASFQIWDALGAGTVGSVVANCVGPR